MSAANSTAWIRLLDLVRTNQLAAHEGVIGQILQEGGDASALVFKLGLHCAQQGAMKDALLIFTCLHQEVLDDPRIAYNLGLIYSALARHPEAVTSFEEALRLEPQDVASLVHLAAAHHQLEKYETALDVLNQAIALDPTVLEAYSLKGDMLTGAKQYQEAIACYEKVLSFNPENSLAWNNKGVALYGLGHYDKALICYDRALSIHPTDAETLSNKANALTQLKRYPEALSLYDQALQIDPLFVMAYSNKGFALNQLKQYKEVIACYDKALALKPDFYDALVHKANALVNLTRYAEAIACLESALQHKRQIDWALGELLHNKMYICQWDGLDQHLQELIKGVNAGKKITIPFPLLSLVDDPRLHLQCARIYADSEYPLDNRLGPLQKPQQQSKIKLGYFSADFKAHAVAFLVAELFELHDRERFEVYGFALAKAPDGDATRERIKHGFDHFYELHDRSEMNIAALARELQIDIAIDLTGLTQESKTKIFAYRAAPIQVAYLGYPSTMGASYMDYLIADHTLIPAESRQCYVEKIAYLPHTYQANDRQRVISEKHFTRQELGLPEKGFVYCCFNKNYKILPKVFDVWMRILGKVPGSVLWLLEDNPSVTINLRAQSQKRGIDPSRLIFAKRLPLLSEHLARHRAADLFLDTVPYNAHTTTSDALWAGLPVLTMMGHSYASRVSASLLKAIELPELITQDECAYEALAIELANNPGKLAMLKAKLANNRLTTPLFDSPLFTRSIEGVYQQMYGRLCAGLPPDHIDLC